MIRWSSISAIGAFSAINTGSGDELFLDPGRCTDSENLRTTVEDAPGADGVIVFPPLDGARILTLVGPMVIRSASSESGFNAAIDALHATLRSDLNALKASAGSLVHSGGTLDVRLYQKLQVAFEQNGLFVCTFGLVVE